MNNLGNTPNCIANVANCGIQFRVYQKRFQSANNSKGNIISVFRWLSNVLISFPIGHMDRTEDSKNKNRINEQNIIVHCRLSML